MSACSVYIPEQSNRQAADFIGIRTKIALLVLLVVLPKAKVSWLSNIKYYIVKGKQGENSECRVIVSNAERRKKSKGPKSLPWKMASQRRKGPVRHATPRCSESEKHNLVQVASRSKGWDSQMSGNPTPVFVPQRSPNKLLCSYHWTNTGMSIKE